MAINMFNTIDIALLFAHKMRPDRMQTPLQYFHTFTSSSNLHEKHTYHFARRRAFVCSLQKQRI
jgi:hypothetical protein